jgi:ankyrin repeat protein
MWAAAEGHASVVKRLIDAGADYKTPLKSGFTPLFFAVRDGHIDVVKLLLDRGIDVNETMPVDAKRGRGPSPGMGPLSLAVENGHFELAVFLLESGADPNDQRSGFAPLHRMVWVRKPDRGDGLDGSPPPEGSGNIDSLQFVKKLVEHGADVNLRLQRSAKGFGRLNKKQATAFLMACKTADLPLMKLLLELKANPTIPNADQTTPLLVAAGIATFAPGEEAGTEPEAIEAIRLLLELGAEINTVDNKGETAMHGAAYKGFPEVARFLDANGADINVWNQENRQGWTPLLIACGYRPGNFRPLAPTIAAIREIMIKRGVTPPDDPRPNRKAEKAQ